MGRFTYLSLAVVFLVVIPLLTAVKLPCPQSMVCGAGGVEGVRVLGVKAEFNSAHCKGLEYNVSVRVFNSASEAREVYVHIDGWDLDLGMHVTEGDVRVRLNPGEEKTVWAMLPIDSQTPKPSYFFNATVVPVESGASQVQQKCACRPGEQIPLYRYLLALVSSR
jgi:hypothetical protein